MTIPFTCPHCGAFSHVATGYAGMTGPCAQCGLKITIPGTPDAPVLPIRVRPPRSRSTWVWISLLSGGLLLIALCAGGMIGVLAPAMNAIREAGQRELCQNNLRQISSALESYHADFGCYPPAVIAAADGTPLHSWRALVLRYLDEELAKEYDFNEPWNSAKHQQLWHRMPTVFACPDNPDSLRQYTSYVAIVGPGFLFTGTQPTNATQFPAPAATMAVAEVAGHVKITWLEPRDLPATALLSIGDRSQPSVSSNHLHGANVLDAGGGVNFLPDAPPVTPTP